MVPPSRGVNATSELMGPADDSVAMTAPATIQEEVERNYAAFKALLPKLMLESEGRWVLLRREKVEAVFDTARDAQVAGEKLFADRLFSVQQVTEAVIDLGWFSHAVSGRTI